MMPGLDGFELLRALRSDPTTRDVPVILLSARAGEESRIQGLEAGADDYLVKPFSARELIARVDAHLQLKRLREESQRQLRANEERLREIDRRKDEFLAMLAHELRNPLAPIRTGLELIRLAGDTPGSVERVRSMMERQVGHMVRLIDDLLDVSRITSGTIHLQRKPTPLADLVNSAVEANRAAIDAGDIQLTVSMPDALCMLDVDPTRFVQIVSNLLHNAAKFTPPAGRIELSAEILSRDGSEDPELVLRVGDSGVGIPTEMLPRVFDLFVQGDQPAQRSPAGLGIGLALARRLVELHGGRIEARSEGADRGSEFIIRLPLRDHAIRDIPSPPSPVAAGTARRVVIIDDHEDAAETLAMLVQELGGASRTAHDGATGLQCVLDFRPDVVLLDIGMPGMDGYETCRRIRQEPSGSDVFIVALTGWGQQQDQQHARDAGFDTHLTKPADPVVLARVLSEPRSGRSGRSGRAPLS